MKKLVVLILLSLSLVGCITITPERADAECEECAVLREELEYHETREELMNARIVAQTYLLDALYYEMQGVGFDYEGELDNYVTQYDLTEKEEELFLDILDELIDKYSWE